MDFLGGKMKFKLSYLYAIVTIVVVITFIIAVNKREDKLTTTETKSEQQMPDDHIHKNLDNSNSMKPGNVSEAIKKRMKELKDQADSNPNDTAKVKEYADFLYEAHKPDEAIPYYQSILSKDPKRKDILFMLTNIYYNKGELDKAEEETKKILKLDKNDLMAKYNLGAIEATRGNNAKAREIWTELINSNPKSDIAELARNALNNVK